MAVKPTKRRFVVEVVVETDVLTTKKAVRAAIDWALKQAPFVGGLAARVRKVDLD